MTNEYSGCYASVGTNVGDIGLWEVGSRERLLLRNFKVWDLSACSMPLQVCPLCSFMNSTSKCECCTLNACNHRVFKTELYEIQAALVKDPGVSVNRVIWSPDGSLFGKLNILEF